MAHNIEERVESLLNDKIKDLGYKLYDVEYAKEGKDYYLRIFIDKDNGTIDLNDCEKVNNEINDILDEADYIKEQYFLEVSSPGIERVLRKNRQLEENIGNTINIKLYRKDENGNKDYQGELVSFDNDILKVKNDEKIIEINRKNITQIKTVFNW